MTSPTASNCKVTVLEAASQLGEIGAGIQVTPNFTRLLYSWGLQEPLEKHGVRAPYVRQVRWKNGKELTRFSLNLNNRMRNVFGVDYFHVHRADLHRMLLDRARELGVQIETGRTVELYQHAPMSGLKPEKIVCKDGTVFYGDVVVAADGAKSTLCQHVLGQRVPASPTGDSAYRALLSREQIMDPIFEDLELHKGSVVWLGPGRHVVGYPVRGGSSYNLVILVPTDLDSAGEESWKLKGDMVKLREQFEGWDYRLCKLLDMVEDSYVWNLYDRPVLDRWLHPQGNLVLLGDSAHPMLPYVAQGAASAAEDGAALAECLSALSEQRDIRSVLEVYENIRKPRTSEMREAGRKNQRYFHVPDG